VGSKPTSARPTASPPDWTPNRYQLAWIPSSPVGRVFDNPPTYASALDHFVRSLEEHAAITPSLDDGPKAQAIAEAATRSLTSHRSELTSYSQLS
jgi:hypothetical protein